jgi:hypothetical protein
LVHGFVLDEACARNVECTTNCSSTSTHSSGPWHSLREVHPSPAASLLSGPPGDRPVARGTALHWARASGRASGQAGGRASERAEPREIDRSAAVHSSGRGRARAGGRGRWPRRYASATSPSRRSTSSATSASRPSRSFTLAFGALRFAESGGSISIFGILYWKILCSNFLQYKVLPPGSESGGSTFTCCLYISLGLHTSIVGYFS